VSAGGVVWRKTEDGQVEILLCYRKAENLWALPKGTPEPGENMEQTASREVREETGVMVEPDGVLGDINYWFSRPAEGVRFRKTVHHYLFRPVGGDTALHDHEFDDARWIEVQEGLKLMTYQNEARIVREALAVINSREGQATP